MGPINEHILDLISNSVYPEFAESTENIRNGILDYILMLRDEIRTLENALEQEIIKHEEIERGLVAEIRALYEEKDRDVITSMSGDKESNRIFFGLDIAREENDAMATILVSRDKEGYWRLKDVQVYTSSDFLAGYLEEMSNDPPKYLS